VTSRLLPTTIFRAHWKGLSDYRDKEVHPDYITRILLVGIPLVAGGLFWGLGGCLSVPTVLLAGVSLLAGAFLGAFGHIATLRSRLADREDDYPDAERIDRDSLDETAAHLLVASYMSALTAFVLVLGMNLSLNAQGALVGFWGGLAVALALYVLLVFMIALPRLYNSYANINKVRDALSGTHKGRG